MLFALAVMGSQISMSSAALPLWKEEVSKRDWLLGGVKEKAGVYRTNHPNELVLANGLVARKFRVQPNLATVALENLVTKESLLRAVRPEAEVTIDGKPYAVGGLVGQPDLAYLTEGWLAGLRSDPDAFQFAGFSVGESLGPLLPWRKRGETGLIDEPRSGTSMVLHFRSPKGAPPSEVLIRYALYDGAPIFRKEILLRNQSDKPILVDQFKAELLGIVEPGSSVESHSGWAEGNLTVKTDYTFAGMESGKFEPAVRLLPDKAYETQVNYRLETPCRLDVAPPLGPSETLPPGQFLVSFKVIELIHDNSDRERRGLAVRRMYRMLAPWTTESPLMLHQTSSDPAVVKAACDQAAECGFEMVILSFGSGLNMEDVSQENIAKYKALADYAHSKGLRLGGYSLLASRSIGPETDVIDPKTRKPGNAVFDNSPCLGSAWGIQYFQNLSQFIRETDFDLLEHDGSYPGDVCASTTHPGHRGLADSQWTQYQQIAQFYRDCRSRGIYLNVPDTYELAGSNKEPMGYRETNWSLPRAQQHIHARQNLFDGTWEKPPTMGWMFTPLVQYQGGGAAATIEPLKDHIKDYELHLVNNLGYGAQSCYRGPRLYDSPEVKAMIQKHVAWFKKYRDILESDVIHVRRADGRNLDCILHVNPLLPIKGLAMVWNPTGKPLRQEITLPLYYTGLSETALLAQEDRNPVKTKLDRSYRVSIKPTVAANGWTWYVIR